MDMKYAVIESGGKQYMAREGETIEVDRMPLSEGSSIKFDKVLLLHEEDEIKIGSPYIAKAKVSGTVIGNVKGRKIIVFRYKPKERVRRKRGHRQQYTQVKIESIKLSK
jgi:large subunit ribosomal protein L21